MTEFTTKERKKAADKIFKEKILPFFQQYGFARHTKTSKRLFKTFNHGLSVFVFLEYKSRFGSYDISVAYFDAEIGDVYDDNYLLLANIKTRSYSGDNEAELNLAADDWLLQLKETFIPFIKAHTTHKELLESDQFYKSKARDGEILALLERKAKL